MADALGPGDWVLCVASGEAAFRGQMIAKVEAGNVYQIEKVVRRSLAFRREFFLGPCLFCGTEHDEGIQLTSDKHWPFGDDSAWCPKRFRSLHRKDPKTVQRREGALEPV